MDQFDLGGRHRKISTSSSEAQKYFDIGLNWCVGFNQEEGAACFHRALEHDPDCAMAHWGVAFASGPFYNFPWCDFSADEAVYCTKLCYDHVRSALALVAAQKCAPDEAALIRALAKRFQKPHPVKQKEFNQWDDGFADAMRDVYQHYPDDLDVMALFIEAMMTRTPWKLWNVKTGAPLLGSDTIEALEVCEKAVDLAKSRGEVQHPAILHLHIHLTEMSNHPERSLWAADELADMCPDAGHLNHMPGHTYVLCGEYDKARIASAKAIAADDKYLDYAGSDNFYTTARCHDLHLMMYTCMFLGQMKPAIEAAEKICETLPPEVLGVEGRPQMAVTLEGYYAMKMHVYVRFGRWQDIADCAMPPDPDLYCVSTAMHHYAKVVGNAALKNFEVAEAELAAFYRSLKNIPETRKFFNNNALTTLGVGEMMAKGELEYHKGNYDIAYDYLRDSVRRDDALEYTEPWAWMHPPRHALAALLMEQGYFTEAEEIYRADLGLSDTLQRCAQHPRNVWALHGLVECLRERDETQEIQGLSQQLTAAQALTDVSVTSSCLCRGMAEQSKCCDG